MGEFDENCITCLGDKLSSQKPSDILQALLFLNHLKQLYLFNQLIISFATSKIRFPNC
jgi:hypothetical protein